MQKKHATYSPSSSSRWLNCTGSIHLTKDIQEKQSPYALQGQAAHWLAEKCLENHNLNPMSFIGTEVTNIGAYILTQEDAEAVKKYIDFMKEELSQAGDDHIFMIEKKLNISGISDDFFGTSDAILVDKSGNLKIYDYKHGVGVLVSVENNYQMKCYALLALAYMRSQNISIKNVEIIIVQPRACDEYISRKFLSPIELKDFQTLVISKIDEIRKTENSPILTPGEAQCRWCPIKAVCPEVMKQNLALAQAEFKDDLVEFPKVEALTENELIKILDHADAFRSWLNSIEEFMYAQAINGKKIPGWKLVSKRAYRKWSDSKSVIEFIKEMVPEISDNIFTKPELKSPAQIETLIKSKKEARDITLLNLNLLQQFIYLPSTSLTLAKESDKRPEVTRSLSAQDEFD